MMVMIFYTFQAERYKGVILPQPVTFAISC
jgi:hypothetical protein